jgi:hypothetical protein
MPLLAYWAKARNRGQEQNALSRAGSSQFVDVEAPGVGSGVDAPAFRPGLLGVCANPGCRSGWLHLWRKRATPVFEDGWTCSAECTAVQMQAAVAREMAGQCAFHEPHRHRIPLGLVMLEQGWISQRQLRAAVDAQKAAGTGRLGHWLVRQRATSAERVTRALGLQWSCPVLSLNSDECETLTATMPRLLVDAYGTVPLRVAAGKVLYLGFEQSLDRALALAVERMTGLRVESGIVSEGQFRRAHGRTLQAKFPAVELVEAASQAAAARALARSVERLQPVAARMVRVHDCLWLRLWLRPQAGFLPDIRFVEDVLCAIGRIQ